jgi:hypothetical protein
MIVPPRYSALAEIASKIVAVELKSTMMMGGS